MTQSLSSPQRYRGFILTAAGLQKLHDRLKKLEAQTRLRQSPRSIAERIQLSDSEGIHSVTVRKILGGQNGVDKRSIQLVFQVLQLPLEEGDYAHAGLCQRSAETYLEIPVKLTSLPNKQDRQDRSEIPDQDNLRGRVHELDRLNRAIVAEHCRLVQIWGTAGIGKTALATLLTRAVQPEFEFVIWKSLRHAPAIQTVLTGILQPLMRHSGKEVELPTQNVEALTGLLIEQLQNHRCLIVFDHFSSVLCSKQYAAHYHQGYEAYRELLQIIAEVSHQSCLMITSREKLRMVGIVEHYSRSLQLRGLSLSECQQIFNCHNEISGTTEDWRSLIQQCHGNPLVLKMLKAYLQDYFNGSISDYLKYLKPGKLLFSDLRDFLKQQFNRLSPLEQKLVLDLAQYQEPVSVLKFREDIASSVDCQNWLEGLDSLDRRSFLQLQEGCLLLDPVMKTYVNECLMKQQAQPSPRLNLEVVPDSDTVA
jgi:hypothetical protein